MHVGALFCYCNTLMSKVHILSVEHFQHQSVAAITEQSAYSPRTQVLYNAGAENRAWHQTFVHASNFTHFSCKP